MIKIFKVIHLKSIIIDISVLFLHLMMVGEVWAVSMTHKLLTLFPVGLLIISANQKKANAAVCLRPLLSKGLSHLHGGKSAQ